MENIKNCKKCGFSWDTSKDSDWTCPNCGVTQWWTIAIYGIFSLICIGSSIFLSPLIGSSFLRFIVKWGIGIIGGIVLLAVLIWIVSALKSPKKALNSFTIAENNKPKDSTNQSKVEISETLGAFKNLVENKPKDTIEEQVEHTFPNGNIYIGGWKDDKMNGWGSLSEKNGYFQYVGNWKDGKLNGQGSLTTTGKKYWGEWKDGLYHGQGNLNDILGKFSYYGSFVNGEMTGRGTMTDSDGTVRTGIWENGRLVG